MKVLNFGIIKLTLALVLGILTAYHLKVSVSLSLALCCFSLIVFLVTNYGIKTRNLKFLKTLLGLITVFFIGCLSITFHSQINHKTHYSKSNSYQIDSLISVQFKIEKVLKPGNYYNKYIAQISGINNEKSSGKLLINIEKDSTVPSLEVDYTCATKTQFKTLIEPLNPHQFNYKSYLEKQHIYHQVFITNSQLLIQDKSRHTIYGLADELRKTINTKLKLYSFEKDELAIINALLLGQRQDISKDIYNSYTQAGAIHILAVSGLHVGIILLILNFLFRPFNYIKNGKIYRTVLILILLWLYAIIAGLSASVVRAVTMFSIVAIGMNWNRPTNIYNSLAISMFVLLLFKPTFLFDVGFQLSYIAVFSIVMYQPMLYNLFNFKWIIPDFFWQIFTVTVSAQIGIIPISLYYFHQFPSLFWVSNLVIIPVLGIILGFGIIVVALALTDLLPEFIAISFGFVIQQLNNFVGWVSNQEAFLFKNIPFTISDVIVSYLLIATATLWIKKKNYKHLMYVLGSVIVFQSVLLFNKQENSSNEFIVFHKSRYSVIGKKEGRKLQLYSNLKTENEKLVTNYIVGESVKGTQTDSLKKLYIFGSKKLLVIDSLSIYNIKSIKPDYLLLQNSPKINLERVIDSLQPKLIISDGSNYKTYQERWFETCRKRKIPFQQTSKKGAFVYKY